MALSLLATFKVTGKSNWRTFSGYCVISEKNVDRHH